jgi:hypothetical protein
MSDPTSGGGSASTKPDNRKPSKALPTDRVSVEKQLKVLRAYGAIAAETGVSGTAISEVVESHPSSVSVCNPFLQESGLIERSGSGYKAVPAVVAYHAATEWDPTTAGGKLAPVLKESWYWKALLPRLSFRPLTEAEAVRVLAEDCGAPPSFEGQIKGILEYLETATLIVRDGGAIKRGPGAANEQEQKTPPTPEVATAREKPPQTEKPVGPGIAFDVSIQVSMDEIGRWSPDQIKTFFSGLADVIAAKARVQE